MIIYKVLHTYWVGRYHKDYNIQAYTNLIFTLDGKAHYYEYRWDSLFSSDQLGIFE